MSSSAGGVTAPVLNASEAVYSDKNENSVELRVSYGSVDLLLTGDAETRAEGRLRGSGHPLQAEILKVAHHGSNSGSCAEFLGAVTSQEAIISVGPIPYEHPRLEVRQRLGDVGANIYRTDCSGTVIVTTNGVTWTVTTSANVPPELGMVTPSSGSGPTGVTHYFTTTWTDANCWEHLRQAGLPA